MTTVSLYPERVAGYSSFEGAATPEDALSDGSNSTWVLGQRGVPLLLEYGPVPGAAPPTVVTTLTTKFVLTRVDETEKTNYVTRLVSSPLLVKGWPDVAAGRHFDTEAVTASTAGSTVTWDQTVNWSAMRVAHCDRLQVRVWFEGPEADSIGITKAEVEVVYSTASTPTTPTVSVTTPTGVLPQSGPAPTVGWTVTGAESAPTPQRNYQVRVFTAAQYGAGGFDPSVDTATWESGVVASDRLGVTVGEALDESTAYRAYVRAHDGVTWSAYAYSAWSYATVPSINATAKTSATGSDVTVAWVYTAGTSSAGQAACRVKVFDSTSADPANDDTHQYDSGWVWQTAPTHQIPGPLVDTGTNRFYVAVRDHDGLESAWDNDTLTLTYSAVSTPAGATVTADDSNGRVTVALPATSTAGTVEVERSTDGGTTYTAIVASGATKTTGTLTVYDYHAPLGTSGTWRWRFVDGTDLGAGSWVSAGSVTPALGTSWVKHPTDSTFNTSTRVLHSMTVTETGSAVSVVPVGRRPVVASDVSGAKTLAVRLHATTWALVATLETLRTSGPVLLQEGGAAGQQWWVRVLARTVEPLDGARADNWAVTWDCVEVAEP